MYSNQWLLSILIYCFCNENKTTILKQNIKFIHQYFILHLYILGVKQVLYMYITYI